MTGVVETNAHCDIIAARAEAAVAAVEIVTNADPAEIPDLQSRSETKAARCSSRSTPCRGLKPFFACHIQTEAPFFFAGLAAGL